MTQVVTLVQGLSICVNLEHRSRIPVSSLDDASSGLKTSISFEVVSMICVNDCF